MYKQASKYDVRLTCGDYGILIWMSLRWKKKFLLQYTIFLLTFTFIRFDWPKPFKLKLLNDYGNRMALLSEVVFQKKLKFSNIEKNIIF